MLDHKLFDHTLLKANATAEQIEQIACEARKEGFASVCVNSAYTAYVARLLEGTGVKTCTVVGFPLGQMAMPAKVFEAQTAIEDGADEIDMVMNVGALKDGRNDYVRAEIAALKSVCGERVLKVIIETCLLTKEEIVTACILAKEAGADFVKTSTGFSTGGAVIEDVELMRRTVGPEMGVKASGGIHTREEAEAFVKAGATRLGTSATMKIIAE